MRRKIFLLIIFFSLVLFRSVNSQAVTEPLPKNLVVERGSSVEFHFQIQTINLKEKYECSYSVSGLEPLRVSFEENSVIIEPGKVKEIHGRIKAPFDAPSGEYTGKLSVSCKPLVKVKGSLITQTTELKLPVEVSRSERVEANLRALLFLLIGLTVWIILIRGI